MCVRTRFLNFNIDVQKGINFEISVSGEIKAINLVWVTRLSLRPWILVPWSRLRQRLNTNNLWWLLALSKASNSFRLCVINDLIRWKETSSDNPYNKLTVNLRNSKNKRCWDRDFSRPEIGRDVETETLWNQEIWPSKGCQVWDFLEKSMSQINIHYEHH